MPLNPLIMIDALKDLSADNEPEAAETWTNMLIDFMKGATGIIPTGFTPLIVNTIRTIFDGPTPSIPPSPSDPDPPLKDGMSAPGAGIAIIQAGFTALWAAMIAAPPTFFAGATLITPPPTLGLIAVDLAAAVPANIALNGSGVPPSTGTLEGDKELATITLVTGGALLPGTGFYIRNLGGTYTVPPAVVTPIV